MTADPRVKVKYPFWLASEQGRLYTCPSSALFAVGKKLKMSSRTVSGTVVRVVPESRTPTPGVEVIFEAPEEVVIEIELNSTQNPVIPPGPLGHD